MKLILELRHIRIIRDASKTAQFSNSHDDDCAYDNVLHASDKQADTMYATTG